MTGRIAGIDEIRKTDGTDLLLGIGFGQTQDWEVIDRQVVSAVSSVNFTFDPTLYDEYELSILEWDSGDDDASILLRTSTNGGSTFDNSASDYSFFWSRSLHTTSPSTTEVGSVGANAVTLVDVTGNATNEETSYKVFMGDLGASTIKKFWGFGIGRIRDGNEWDLRFSGTRLATTAVDGLQLLPSSGTFSGTFILRGRRKNPQTFGGNDDWEIIDDQTGISAVSNHDVFWANGVYDEIEICAWGVVPGTDDRDLQLRLSTDGSTFLGGAGDYKHSSHASNDSPADAPSGSSSATEITVSDAMGTGTDEHKDVKVEIHNASDVTRKKTLNFSWSGISSDATYSRGNGGGILMDNDDGIQGFQFIGESSATFSADRIRVRGRRVLASVVQVAGGDFVHLGTFTVLSGGDTFIDVDFRTSVNPQFADFTDMDYTIGLSGNMGPGNSQLEYRVLRLGVQQAGGSDYKDDSSDSRSAIRVTKGTVGSGRKVQTEFVIARANNTVDESARIIGASFGVSSTGGRLSGVIGGQSNALAAGINDGFRVFNSNDMDDIVIDVWARRKSQT